MQVFYRIFELIRSWVTLKGEPELVHPPYLWWQPERTLAEIRADNEFLKIGKYLHLEQTLESGELGCTMSKIQTPGAWIVVSLAFKGEQLIIETKEHGKFQLNCQNQGPLMYDVLCAGKNNYAQLECIWSQHAKMVDG